MVVAHVRVTCAADYLTRREPHRRAHIERLLRLRQAGTLVAGGPAPDGRQVDVYYRVPALDALPELVEQDPYFVAGAWTGWTPQAFDAFVDPWEAPAVLLDGSRVAWIAEGPATDSDMAQLALVELRGQGRLTFGGLFPRGATHAVMPAADAGQAIGWLAATGSWKADELTARPWLYVL